MRIKRVSWIRTAEGDRNKPLCRITIAAQVAKPVRLLTPPPLAFTHPLPQSISGWTHRGAVIAICQQLNVDFEVQIHLGCRRQLQWQVIGRQQQRAMVALSCACASSSSSAIAASVVVVVVGVAAAAAVICSCCCCNCRCCGKGCQSRCGVYGICHVVASRGRRWIGRIESN